MTDIEAIVFLVTNYPWRAVALSVVLLVITLIYMKSSAPERRKKYAQAVRNISGNILLKVTQIALKVASALKKRN